MTKLGKGTIAFRKNAYNEYTSMKIEVKGFLELLPDEWESFSFQKCISGSTCLSNALKKQAQSVSRVFEKLKTVYNDFKFDDTLQECKNSVEEVSLIIDSVKNISKFVKEFSVKEEIITIRDLSRRITGKSFSNDDNHESQVSFLLHFQSTELFS